MVGRELVHCEFVDFKFLRHAKFLFVEKLKSLGFMGLLEVSDIVYPQLIRLCFSNFEKLEPKSRGTTCYTTKVKDTIITLTTAMI